MFVSILSFVDVIHKTICKIFVNIATVLLIIMTAIIVTQIFLRYFFNSPLSWPEEISVYLMMWMSYLCLPYLIYTNSNISMTLFSDKVKGRRLKHILNILYVMFIIFTAVVWYPFALLAIKNSMEITLTQVPVAIGVIYYIIPVSLFFVITMALQRLYTSLLLLFNIDIGELIKFKVFHHDQTQELE